MTDFFIENLKFQINGFRTCHVIAILDDEHAFTSHKLIQLHFTLIWQVLPKLTDFLNLFCEKLSKCHLICRQQVGRFYFLYGIPILSLWYRLDTIELFGRGLYHLRRFRPIHGHRCRWYGSFLATSSCH